MIPDGYYALPDPDNPAVMTYWHAKDGRIQPWPTKAWHGPLRLLKRDMPKDRDRMIAVWREWQARYGAWANRVHDALDGDPHPARARFSAFTTRCFDCGRALTDAKSKTLGLGPDCRGGLDEAWLASVMTPMIAAAHAAHAGGA